MDETNDRVELLQGTLDMLILRTLLFGAAVLERRVLAPDDQRNVEADRELRRDGEDRRVHRNRRRAVNGEGNSCWNSLSQSRVKIPLHELFKMKAVGASIDCISAGADPTR